MFWKLVQLVFGLAIVVPIIAVIFYKFTNSTNGTFVNSTEVNSTAIGVTTAELSYWSFWPIAVGIIILVFIGILIAGALSKKGE